MLIILGITSPSESEEQVTDELVVVVPLDEDDNDALESEDEPDDVLLEVEEELELLSLFLATGFFSLPLCSCSSCLANSLCNICSLRSKANSSSWSNDFSQSPLSPSALLLDFDVGFVGDLVLLFSFFKGLLLRLLLLFLPSFPLDEEPL